MITLVIVVVIWGVRGFVFAVVHVTRVFRAVFVCVRERMRSDEEKEQVDPVVIDCWTWLYSKSLPL